MKKQKVYMKNFPKFYILIKKDKNVQKYKNIIFYL